eukprot:scaffold8918_cov59-Phaeocystis_antarctica.AAC.5
MVGRTHTHPQTKRLRGPPWTVSGIQTRCKAAAAASEPHCASRYLHGIGQQLPHACRLLRMLADDIVPVGLHFWVHAVGGRGPEEVSVMHAGITQLGDARPLSVVSAPERTIATVSRAAHRAMHPLNKRPTWHAHRVAHARRGV